MVKSLIMVGVPALGILVALGLSNLIFKKKHPVKKWHGGLGIVISIIMIFVAIGFLQKTHFDIPFMITGLILVIFSFAVFKAAERQEEEQKTRNKSDQH